MGEKFMGVLSLCVCFVIEVVNKFPVTMKTKDLERCFRVVCNHKEQQKKVTRVQRRNRPDDTFKSKEVCEDGRF